MLAPVATKALMVSFPMPDVPPTNTDTRGAVASLMRAFEARTALSDTIEAVDNSD